MASSTTTTTTATATCPSPPLSSVPTPTQQPFSLTAICVVCNAQGCDVRIKSCLNNCAYHARCLDVMSIRQHHSTITNPNSSLGGAQQHQHQQQQQNGLITGFAQLIKCPNCNSPASGLEMLPLSFVEMDSAQRLSGNRPRTSAPNGLGGISILSTSPTGGGGGGGNNKRMHCDITGGDNSSSSALLSSNFYDPATPRTGKWSDDEIAFRDALIPHFVDGSLPLSSGLKLIDFLSTMLKSKPSRLTKKMKHAKLSTRHFRLDAGYINNIVRAQEVSKLEFAFINSITDPVERSEIKFHMQKEWRDHLAERFTYLRISFGANEWLKSVDIMDRRIALAKSRDRMVKRRFMMGKAIEKDTSSPQPGIFIDNTFVDSSGQNVNDPGEDVDFDLLASALETDQEDADLKALYSSMAADNNPAAVASTSNLSTAASTGGGGGIGAGASMNGQQQQPPQFRSVLLPNLGSAEGPNFKFAAPFLAKITSYIEHHRIPFEHVDIWVPSTSDPTGATAPEPSVLGSGKEGNVTGRLCFAGSASVGVQIVTDEMHQQEDGTPSQPAAFDAKMHGSNLKVIPLSSDEIYHMSLFGSYSEKFSFSYGCGLPGRVYESAVPAWEQFVSNAPSHLFERRGGASQFGIMTTVGLPIRSPNVGRIVLVLYSMHNRVKDDHLVGKMMRDFEALNPSPRWKLMVEMNHNSTNNASMHANEMAVNGQSGVGQAVGGLTAALEDVDEKTSQINNLIALLGENMPSDASSPLGQQINNIMSLRLVLLRKNRNIEEEQLVDSILTLFDSYVKAGRSRSDITLLVSRDFAFHVTQLHMQQQNGMNRQISIPSNMQQLSLGMSQSTQSMASLNQMPPQEHTSQQLMDHTHHGQQQSNPPMAASFSGLMERNYSNPKLEISPNSTSASLSRLDNKTTYDPVNDPTAAGLPDPPERLN